MLWGSFNFFSSTRARVSQKAWYMSRSQTLRIFLWRTNKHFQLISLKTVKWQMIPIPACLEMLVVMATKPGEWIDSFFGVTSTIFCPCVVKEGSKNLWKLESITKWIQERCLSIDARVSYLYIDIFNISMLVLEGLQYTTSSLYALILLSVDLELHNYSL